MGACLGVGSRLRNSSPQMDLNGSTHANISSSLAVLRVELIRSFSFNSLKEVTGCLADMNLQLDDVVSIILDYCKKDVWKNGELSRLVEEYVGINRPETLLHNFTMTIDKCLNEVRERQLMAPLRCFEEEDEAEKGDGKYACRTTLEELRNLIKDFGDSFGEELQSVNAQQLSVMEKLERRKQKVDKKLKSIKTWRKVFIITFASAFVAVLIGSVVAAAMAAPPTVAAALTAAASVPVGSMGKWFDSLWKKYQDALKGEKKLISAMKRGTCIIAIMELDIICHVVEQLEIQIDAILVTADSALGDEEAVKIGIGEIKTKLGDFMNSIEDLGKQVDMCTGKVTEAKK